MDIDQNNFDVVVIGGGAAGMAAACSAAKLGKRVALFEKAAYLGGKATAAYVGTICGAYLRSETNLGKFICDGWPKSFIKDLAQLSQTEVEKAKEGIQYLPYDQFQFKKLAEANCLESKVHLFFQSTLTAVQLANQKINKITVLVNDTIQEYKTHALIDCSGEAVLVNLLNLNKIQSDKYQAAAKVFGLGNIPTGTDLQNLKLTLFKSVKKGILAKKIDARLEHISIVPGSFKNNTVYLKIGLPTIVDGQLNQMTALNIESRKLIVEILNYLNSEVALFKNVILTNVPSEVGIRTGQRHLGQYILTQSDVLNANKSRETIARGAWPIEFWDYGYKPKMEYFREEDYFDIPYQCLKSNQIENLYFAGRNISADNGAIASCRVIGTCLQTGFSAGVLSSYGNENITGAISYIHNHLKIGNEYS